MAITKSYPRIPCYKLTKDKRVIKSTFASWVMNGSGNMRVAATTVSKKPSVWVSTVFIGFPTPFETMVFGGALDTATYRDANTWKEALAQHKAVVKEAKKCLTTSKS